jgi:uncharacterized membrane-anchored protein
VNPRMKNLRKFVPVSAFILLYPLTALVGGMLLIAWRVLLHRRPQPVTVEEPEDYGTPVAQV